MPTDSFIFKVSEQVQSLQISRKGVGSSKVDFKVKHLREIVRGGFIPNVYETDEELQEVSFDLAADINDLKKLESLVYLVPDNLNDMVNIHSGTVKLTIQSVTDDLIVVSPFTFVPYLTSSPMRPYLNNSIKIAIEAVDLDEAKNLVTHYKVIKPSTTSINSLLI